MNIITKVFLLLCICLIGNQLNAQTYSVSGGVNLSNLKIKSSKEVLSSSKFKPGIHLGINVEFPLSSSLSFETGLSYSMKGKISIYEREEGHRFVSREKINYLVLPLLFVSSKEINDGLSLSVAAGPYLAYLTKMKSKVEETVDGVTQTYTDYFTVGFDSEENAYLPVDFGLTIGGSIKFGLIETGLFYDIGLMSISHSVVRSEKTRTLRLSAAYAF